MPPLRGGMRRIAARAGKIRPGASWSDVGHSEGQLATSVPGDPFRAAANLITPSQDGLEHLPAADDLSLDPLERLVSGVGIRCAIWIREVCRPRCPVSPGAAASPGKDCRVRGAAALRDALAHPRTSSGPMCARFVRPLRHSTVELSQTVFGSIWRRSSSRYSFRR
jgi:hypothetical protein